MTTNRLLITLLIFSSLSLGSFLLVYAQDDTDLDSIVNDVVSSTDAEEAEIARQKALEDKRLRQEELARQRAIEKANKSQKVPVKETTAISSIVKEDNQVSTLIVQQTPDHEPTIDESKRIEFKGYRMGTLARYPSLRQCIIPSEDEQKSLRIVCPRVGEYQITIDSIIAHYAQRIGGQDKTNQLILLNARKEEISTMAPSFLDTIIAEEKADGQLFIEYTQYMIDMYIWIADNQSLSLLPSLSQH